MIYGNRKATGPDLAHALEGRFDFDAACVRFDLYPHRRVVCGMTGLVRLVEETVENGEVTDTRTTVLGRMNDGLAHLTDAYHRAADVAIPGL